MEPATLINVLLAIAFLMSFLMLFYERSEREKDLERYRDATTKHRSLVAEQKDELVATIVERADLYAKKLPTCDIGIFNKVADLYADPALDDRDFPLVTDDGGRNFYWATPLYAMSNREVFTLWLERIIH